MKLSILQPALLGQALMFVLLSLVGLTVTPAMGAESVLIGVLAKRGPDETLRRWAPMAEYLTETVPGTRFSIVPLPFDSVYRAAENKSVDFILANSGIYVGLEADHGASRIVTLRNRGPNGRGYTQFGGVVFTRSDRTAIETFDDLKGLRFAAVEEDSLGGYLAAWRAFQRDGVELDDLAELEFLGTHDAVVHAVLAGETDAGTVRTDTLERMAAEGKIDLSDIRVVEPQFHVGFDFRVSTSLYPEWPLAKVEGTSDRLSDRVAAALLAMPEDSPGARTAHIKGWTVPGNYQSVHGLMRELKIGPYAHLRKITFDQIAAQFGPWLVAGLTAVLLLAFSNAQTAVRVRRRTGELEQTLAQLRESNKRLELARRDWNEAFDAIADPIFIHDEQLRIVHANPAYVQAAGVTLEAMVGRLYYEVFPKLEGPLQACRAFPEVIDRAGEEIALPSGQILISRSFGIRRADGSISNAIHILEDVTRERHGTARRRMLSRALEQGSEGVVIADPEWTVLYANSALERLLRCSGEGLKGQTVAELLPERHRNRLSAIARAARDGQWSGELELVDADGRAVPVYLSASAIREDRDVVGGFVITVVDLRALKHAQSELEYRFGLESAVAQIAARFVAAGTALDGDIQWALGKLGRLVDADRAYLFRYDAGEDTVSNTHEWTAPEVSPQQDSLQALSLSRFSWARERLMKCQTVHVSDVTTLPTSEREELQRQGVRSMVNVPMTVADEFFGFIGFDNVRSTRAWDEADITLLQAVGEIVTNALKRREAEQDLKRTTASLAQAQRIAQLGNWDWDIETNRLWWSDEIYRIFGLEPQAFAATYTAFLERVHPDDRPRVADAVQAAIDADTPYVIDHRVLLPEGGESIVQERGEVMREEGRPVRMIGTVQDVTAVRRTEAELLRLNRALRTLSRANGVLVHASEEQELLDQICQVLVENGGYHFAWVGYAEDDPARTVRPAAHAGHEGGYLEQARITWSDDEFGRGPAGTAIREGRPVIIRDTDTDPAFAPWREQALERGYASVIAFPLRNGDRCIGVLTIYAAESDAFDSAEIRLLEELAGDLAFGIRTIRLRAERERAEQALAVSERKFHELYDSAPTAYVSVSARDGALLHFNPMLTELLGYSAHELRKMRVFDLYPDTPDGLHRARELFERFRRGESIHDAELQMKRRDGQPLWVSLSVEPVFDSEGEVVESRSSILDISGRKRAEEERATMAGKLQRALLQTIEAVSITIEKRDPYTAGHQQRVAELAVAIGRKLGLEARRLEGLRLGAMIHDIGKIYVPTEILNRPGKLDPIQFDLVKSHPQVGYEIVRNIDFPWPLADMVLQHHERLDGSGYPVGLKGEEISYEARILAVADVIEAMASHRPYRPALPLETALAEITTRQGVWYDPEVVRACETLFRDEGFSWGGDSTGQWIPERK